MSRLSLILVVGSPSTRSRSALLPPVRVVVLSTFDLDDHALRAIRAGASGFLLGNAPPEELLTALRTEIAAGLFVAEATSR